MRARVSRNKGAHGANEWKLEPWPWKRGVPCTYGRIVVVTDVEFVTDSAGGYAIGDAEIVESVPEGNWIPVWFRPPRGAFWCEDRVVEGCARLVASPSVVAIENPRFRA